MSKNNSNVEHTKSAKVVEGLSNKILAACHQLIGVAQIAEFSEEKRSEKFGVSCVIGLPDGSGEEWRVTVERTGKTYPSRAAFDREESKQ